MTDIPPRVAGTAGGAPATHSGDLGLGALLPAVLDELPDTSVIVFDSDLRFVLTRGGAVAGNRMDPGQLEGRLASEALSPERWQWYEALYRAALRGESSSLEVASPDGTHQYLVRVAPLRNGEGRIVGGVSVATDMTEKHRVMQALAASEARFRQAMDAAGIGMLVASPEGRFMRVNPALCRLLGYQAAERTGRAFADITHPDDLAPGVAAVEQFAAGRTEPFVQRKRYVTRRGDVVWADLALAPIEAPDGTVGTLRAQLVDVTAEVARQQDLHVALEKYRLLAENASDIVLLLDQEDRIEWVSPSVRGVLAWQPGDLLGKLRHEVLGPGPEAGVGATDLTRYECRWADANGGRRWMWVTERALAEASTGLTVISARDAEAEHRAREEVARSEQVFRAAIAFAPTGMAVVDLDRRFTAVNPALCGLLARSEDWLLARRVPDVLHPDDDEIDLRLRARLLAGHERSLSEEKRVRHPDGSIVWVEHAVALLRDDDGTPTGYVSQYTDVTAARRHREDLRYRATHDPLTRLINRQELLNLMDGVLRHPPRKESGTAVLFLDVDGLKSVNDTLGHGAGDTVLVELAERMSRRVRSTDAVARLGGDEYVVLLNDIAHEQDVLRLADGIRDSVAEPILVAGRLISVTASVGAALAQPGELPEALLERADRALYRAKREGRDRTVTSSTAADPPAG